MEQVYNQHLRCAQDPRMEKLTEIACFQDKAKEYFLHQRLNEFFEEKFTFAATLNIVVCSVKEGPTLIENNMA